MAIPVKNPDQIARIRESCAIVKEVLMKLEKTIAPGITTRELDSIAYELIKARGATPSFKGYHGYPASICSSINEEVIHGIPGLRKLVSGDIISIDVGAFKDGYHGDAARTFAVGQVREEEKNLVEVTRQSFFEGIKYAVAGSNLYKISEAIQACAEQSGYSVVRDFVGHGIGRAMHEEPQIPNYRMPKRGPRLYSGMTLAIEPMVNVGGYAVKILEDGWTVVTCDKKCSAHYENTIVITDGEPEILTMY